MDTQTEEFIPVLNNIIFTLVFVPFDALGKLFNTVALMRPGEEQTCMEKQS